MPHVDLQNLDLEFEFTDFFPNRKSPSIPYLFIISLLNNPDPFLQYE